MWTSTLTSIYHDATLRVCCARCLLMVPRGTFGAIFVPLKYISSLLDIFLPEFFTFEESVRGPLHLLFVILVSMITLTQWTFPTFNLGQSRPLSLVCVSDLNFSCVTGCNRIFLTKAVWSPTLLTTGVWDLGLLVTGQQHLVLKSLT